MRIVVCTKQTIDTEAVISLDEQGRVVTEGQTLVIDPYSEFAVEKAIQIKESQGAEVVILTIGDSNAVSAIRHALSMGADEAYHIKEQVNDSLNKTLILSAALKKLDADLVLGGCKSADTSNAQTLPRVAVALDIPHVNVVTDFDIEGSIVKATREIDDGFEIIEVSMPAIISAQQGLAEPRYPNVRDIMQSKKKSITEWTLGEVGISLEDEVLVSRGCRLKPERQGGRILEGETSEAVFELVELLHV